MIVKVLGFICFMLVLNGVLPGTISKKDVSPKPDDEDVYRDLEGEYTDLQQDQDYYDDDLYRDLWNVTEDSDSQVDIKLVSKPETFVLSAPSVVMLPCQASISDDVVRVWSKDSTLLIQGTINAQNKKNIKLYPNGSLEVSIQDEDDYGQYVCKLLISETLQPEIVHTIVRKTRPTIVALYANDNRNVLNPGDTLTLTCQATGFPKPKISWQRNNERLSTEVYHGTEGETLTILQVQERHSGSYLCLADNNVEKPDQKHIDIFVNLSPKPDNEEVYRDLDSAYSFLDEDQDYYDGDIYPAVEEVTEDNQDDIKLVPKPKTIVLSAPSVVMLPCQASVSDDVSRLWIRDGYVLVQGNIDMNQKKNMKVYPNGSLEVSIQDENDYGQYVCILLISKTSKPEIVYTIVSETRPTIVALYANDNRTLLNPGDTLSLTCQATGFPKPKISWQRNNERLSTEGESLTIPQVQERHSGSYLCLADNNVEKSDQKHIDIFVNLSPKPDYEDVYRDLERAYTLLDENQDYYGGDIYPVVEEVTEDNQVDIKLVSKPETFVLSTPSVVMLPCQASPSECKISSSTSPHSSVFLISLTLFSTYFYIR